MKLFYHADGGSSVADSSASRSRFCRARFVIAACAATVLVAPGALFFTGLSLPSANAAPRRPATLSFRVSARFDARQSGSSMGQPQQTVDARVLASGNRVRVETRLSEQPIVLLFSAPYIYKLLPATKAGVRYNTGSKTNAPEAAGGFDLQRFLSNPSLIRSLLQKQGAKRGAATVLNGTPVETYSASNFMGQGQNVKVWLRRADALPLRLEARSNSLMSVISWRDYKRNAPLPNALFTPPAGYKIRNSQSRPSLF